MPKFSIIIPVYNVEKYIKQALESVVNQTFKDFEAIIVDDCGNDCSVKIVKEFADNDQRFRIIHHECNKGLSAARNTALKVATGDYIVCLDSDDWLEPNCLEILYANFSLHNTESVWFNARKYYHEKAKFDKKPMYNYQEGELIISSFDIASYADFTWIKSYTRKSIQEYSLEWPEGLTFEDGELTYTPSSNAAVVYEKF